jgi:predicted nuclease of predicted toxin-antitoxin system
MKFIVDAHIPKKLSLFLEWKGHDSIHTLDLPNKNRSKDSEINQISLDEKRVLISKDLDFIESLLISNKPYKLIYISTGNITNRELLALFGKNIEKIIEYVADNRLIEITNKSIVVKG